MFSLIITIITIVLVAALAVATIYYGGDILVSQKAKANAATLDAQTQQIFAASQAYYLDNNAWPANVAVLAVDGKYLKTAPVPPGSAYAALPPTLMGAAYADGDGAVVGTLPELNKAKEVYLESDSDIATDFKVAAEDAAVLRAQLVKLNGRTDANGADLATRALQMMQREVAVQATGRPSLLDYTWPAAAAQNPRTRYLWIPSKVNKETCRAVNVQWRQSILIPDSYSATHGTVQCFGDDTAGYSYFWLSPGADPNQIVLPGQPSGGSDPATCTASQVLVNGQCMTKHVLPVPEVTPVPVGLGLLSPVNFGERSIGTPATITHVVTNSSGVGAIFRVDLAESSPSSGLQWGALTEIVVVDGCNGQLLQPDASCSITMTWTPVMAGPLTYSLYVERLDGDGWGVEAGSSTGTGVVVPLNPVRHLLTMNPGQVGGGGVYAKNGGVNWAGHIWYDTPEADVAPSWGWGAITGHRASFCPSTEAGSDYIRDMVAPFHSWGLYLPEVQSYAYAIARANGTWCLWSRLEGLRFGTNPGGDVVAQVGAYPFSIAVGFGATAGYLEGALIVKADPPMPAPTPWSLVLGDQGALTGSLDPEVESTLPAEAWGLERLALLDQSGVAYTLPVVTGLELTGMLSRAEDIGVSRLNWGGDGFWAAGVWGPLLAAHPDVQLSRAQFKMQGLPDEFDVALASVEGQGTGWYELTYTGPEAYPLVEGQRNRHGGSVFNKADQQVYNIWYKCDQGWSQGDGMSLEPAGPLSATIVASGYRYNSPPLVAKLWVEGSVGAPSVEVPLVPDAAHRATGGVSAAALASALTELPGYSSIWMAVGSAEEPTANGAAGTLRYSGRGPFMVVDSVVVGQGIESYWGPNFVGSIDSPAYKGPCPCFLDTQQYGYPGTAQLPHGATVTVPYQNGQGEGLVTVKCTDGELQELNSQSIPLNQPLPDGGATWGSWQPVGAFSGLGCNTPGDLGHCQVSGASTGVVCPQWGFIASGGTHDGCLRRRCDHPVMSASFIPGC